jgi:hypothetical protein
MTTGRSERVTGNPSITSVMEELPTIRSEHSLKSTPWLASEFSVNHD